VAGDRNEKMENHIEKPFWKRVLWINLWLIALLATVAFARNIRVSHWVDDAVASASAESGIPARLIMAVMRKESRFNPNAVGAAGEIGLMQIMPETAEKWARSMKMDDFDLNQLYDPTVNARIGAWYLKYCFKVWNDRKDPLPYVLASYNAGPKTAKDWAEIEMRANIPFLDAIAYPVTQIYVTDITADYLGTSRKKAKAAKPDGEAKAGEPSNVDPAATAAPAN